MEPALEARSVWGNVLPKRLWLGMEQSKRRGLWEALSAGVRRPSAFPWWRAWLWASTYPVPNLWRRDGLCGGAGRPGLVGIGWLVAEE